MKKFQNHLLRICQSRKQQHFFWVKTLRRIKALRRAQHSTPFWVVEKPFKPPVSQCGPCTVVRRRQTKLHKGCPASNKARPARQRGGWCLPTRASVANHFTVSIDCNSVLFWKYPDGHNWKCGLQLWANPLTQPNWHQLHHEACVDSFACTHNSTSLFLLFSNHLSSISQSTS